ncbi:MAG: hypothetical protein ACE5JL_09775, partial [Dehalococcoidia bacterium]
MRRPVPLPGRDFFFLANLSRKSLCGAGGQGYEANGSRAIPTAIQADKTIKVVASPMQFDDAPFKARAPAPELGQHTEEVLLELGYTWADIGRLKEQKVII